jgi:predicted outer membrane protein
MYDTAMVNAVIEKAMLDKAYCRVIVEQHQTTINQMFAWQRSRNPLKRYFGRKWQQELVLALIMRGN